MGEGINQSFEFLALLRGAQLGDLLSEFYLLETFNHMKKIIIAIITFAVISFFVMIVSFFSSSISGQVVDDRNEQPISDAVVLVEWTITTGLPGLTSTKIQRVAEDITDKKGKFFVFGTFNPFVNPPRMLVYKRGYTAWNNEYLFPYMEHRPEKRVYRGMPVRLQQFVPDYPAVEPLDINTLNISPALKRGVKLYRWTGEKTFDPKKTFYSHMDFVEFLILETRSKMNKALEWEEEKARMDLDTLIELDITGTVVDAKTHKPIKDALLVVEGRGAGYIAGEYWESRSNKTGKVKIFARVPLFARPPSIKIHKDGYQDWESFDKIKWRNKEGIWKNNVIFELNR